MPSVLKINLNNENEKSFFEPNLRSDSAQSQSMEKLKKWVVKHLNKSTDTDIASFDPHKKFRLVYQSSKETRLDKVTLSEYAQLFDIEKLKKLLNQAGVTKDLSIKKDDRPLFHRACYLGLVDLIEFHMRNGVDPTMKDEDGNTPLHTVIKSSQLTESQKYSVVLILLEDLRVDVNIVNVKGETPLHLACDQGLKSLILLFLSLNADIGSKDTDSKTPLDRISHLSLTEKVKIIQIFLKLQAQSLHVRK